MRSDRLNTKDFKFGTSSQLIDYLEHLGYLVNLDGIILFIYLFKHLNISIKEASNGC